MPKGMRNAPNLDHAVCELYGGIKQQVIYFAAEVGVSASWVAERISALLSPERERVLDHLSTVRHETSANRTAMEPLALAVNTHSSETPTTIEAQPKPRKLSPYWSKMSPKQRAAEMRKRQKKWSKAPKEKWGVRASGKRSRTTPKSAAPPPKAASKRPPLDAERKAKQAIYVERSKARKEGRPLPPLPGESVATVN